MEKPIYVIGHKNPDCDAIVSAISYANFKKNMGVNACAGRLGTCNSETQFLLKKFGFDQPELLHTAKCKLSEIELDEAVLVEKDLTMNEALNIILQRKNKGVFVVDENKKLLGIVSISDLTSLWMDKPEYLKALIKKTSLENIKRTIKGKIYNKGDDFKPDGEVYLMPSLSDNAIDYKDSIVIVGNNPDIQRYLIEAGAALIIICGEDWIDSVTLQKSKDKGVSIIHTPISVLSCSKLIFMSASIENVMTSDVISFSNSSTVEEVSSRMAKTRFRTYPVINENLEVVNAVSRYHLFNYEKKKFILVDHNEMMQSINDLEYGEIVGVVDHHRFGGMETNNPVSILAKTVGACSTIVAQQYFEYGLEIPKNLAGLLLGAIISDTLSLKSPTTTSQDIEMAEKLSGIAGISIESLSQEIIEASDSLLNKSHLELLYDDFKEFRIEGCRVAIGQAPCKNKTDFEKVKTDFLKYLEEVALTQQYDLILFLFTDPLGSGSYFLYTGKKSWVINEGFKGVLKKDFAKKIISRKKQVLPMIIETLSK